MLWRTQRRNCCCLRPWPGFLKWEVTLTLPSLSLSHVLVASDNERTLHLPVKLLLGKQIIKTTALIDSEATGNLIDLGLLSLANFPLKNVSTCMCYDFSPFFQYLPPYVLLSYSCSSWDMSLRFLLIIHPFHSHLIILWLPHTIPLYYRKGIFLICVLLLSRTLPPPLGSLVPSM